MSFYQITVFVRYSFFAAQMSNTFSTKAELLKFLKKCEERLTPQEITIVFSNNTHLDDPEFLAQVEGYQYHPHVNHFHTEYNSSTHAYTIAFDLYTDLSDSEQKEEPKQQ